MAGGLYSDEEYLRVLEDRAREAKEHYRMQRLKRFVATGFTLKQANRLELAGVACHAAEDLLAAGATPDQAVRILL